MGRPAAAPEGAAGRPAAAPEGAVGRHRLPALALALAVGVLAAAPAASQAATLGLDVVDGHQYVRFAAAPGEVNQLQVAPGPGGTIAFTDPGATVDAVDGTCVEVSAHEARCLAVSVPAIGVALGDHDDSVSVSADKPGRYDGDAGNDVLLGGPGDETLLGDGGNDVLDGRDGADLLGGGAGSDTARYANRTARVTVDLDATVLGTEGGHGEGDTVASDVERVLGGAGNDLLTGNDAANVLDGGAGNDTLTGGRGADDLRGGAGNDRLRARDGFADRLDCGTQTDDVEADGTDQITNCETGVPSGGGVAHPPASPGLPLPPLPAPFGSTSPLGSLELPTAPVTLEHGRVALSMSCPIGTPGGRCTGVISLATLAPKSKKAHSSRRTRRFRSAGDQAYSIRAGKKSKVRIRLARSARAQVNRKGSAKFNVYLRRTKRSKRSTRVGVLKVHASRRTKRRAHPKSAS